MKVQELVEAEGHLIDSHIMEQIFDTVVECEARYHVEHFSIGRTNSEPSRLRLQLEADSRESMNLLLGQLLGLGCSPVESVDAETKRVERDCLRGRGDSNVEALCSCRLSTVACRDDALE